ncbi:hypothetical protein T260_05005 [Geobacillus thermopakistaniensis]|uniref:Uncharacterized protein n=1 Tax=Geobacillus thermopakistaniensis (strain MAS1) TaxID=1408282 RepID=A0A7U9JCK9_GEOTM|nr:hypothetical protein T260_05005 [Geobacillus sp. MAS1]
MSAILAIASAIDDGLSSQMTPYPSASINRFCAEQAVATIGRPLDR